MNLSGTRSAKSGIVAALVAQKGIMGRRSGDVTGRSKVWLGRDDHPEGCVIRNFLSRVRNLLRACVHLPPCYLNIYPVPAISTFRTMS